jgi:protein-tyrosine kinase
MGRVDDAARRAARGVSLVEPMPAEDARRLGHEPFPPELSDSRPPASAAEILGEPFRPSADGTAIEPPVQRATPRAGLVGKLVADVSMPADCREQYRRLAATLYHTQVASGLKVVMVASAVAGEGKTLTAANLALTFSESYKRTVLLIDADLRRPSLHTIFQIDATPGLSDTLMTSADHEVPLHRVSDRLTVLAAGRPSADPMAGLTSHRMQRLIDDARAAFDWVIIDTPPVGLMTDANLLAAMVDGALMVVKAESTPYTLVQRAADAIGRDRLLGAVLNRAIAWSQHGQKYYYYNEYTSRPEPAGPGQ